MALGWKVKPRLGKNRRKAPRLGSLETWRSDLMVESSTPSKLRSTDTLLTTPRLGRGSKVKQLSVSAGPRLVTDLSVVGSKPTASSPVFSQLPGANLTKVSRENSHRSGGTASPIPSPPAVSRMSSIGSTFILAPVLPSPRILPQSNSPRKPQVQSPRTETILPAVVPAEPQPAKSEVVVEVPRLTQPTLSLESLGGKLMEVDALLRHQFATRQELCKVQNSVEAALGLLADLPDLAREANVIEGTLFQELLQRLGTAPDAHNPPKSRKNMPCSPSVGARALLVSRTPIPGTEREHWQSHQSIRDLFGGDEGRLSSLMERVQALRGLLRIKIEDNRDLDLARRALGDVKCAIDNLWWYAEGSASATGEDSKIEGKEDSLGVTRLLQKMRA